MKGFFRVACLLLLVTLLVGLPALPAQVAEAKTPQGILDSAAEVFREMANQGDVSTMAALVRDAEGLAIFPSVIKAALIFGGRYGEGVVLRRDRNNGGWFGPSFYSIGGASWGLQVGGQSTALVLVIMNEKGMKGFRGDKFTLGGDLAVAVGPVGRQTGVGTDEKFRASIYSYSLNRGIFAGVSLEGAVISTLEEKNKEFWGRAMTSQETLNTKTTDHRVQSLIYEINQLIAKAE